MSDSSIMSHMNYQAELSFFEPHFLNADNSLMSKIYYRDLGSYQIPLALERRIGIEGTVAHKLKYNKNLSTTLTTGVEYIHLSEGDANNIANLYKAHGLDIADRAKLLEGGFFLRLAPGLAYDSRDSAVNPRHGALASVRFEEAFGLDGFGKTNGRLTGMVKKFIPIAKKSSLTFTGRGGIKLHGSDMPEIMAYRLGGPYTIRGYKVIGVGTGVYTDYVMDELHSSADSRYSIDVTLTKEEQNADTFTLENGGSGTIYISSINVSNECDMNEKYILQIIKSATSDAPQLDYDNSKVLNQAEAIMTSDIILAKEFGLASTTTKNDSLEIRGLQDTFVAWAEYETPIWSGLTEQEDKIFTFVDDSTTILSKDVSELKGINLTINGANNTFDVNNKDFLSSVNENQNVTISNINITNNNDEATDNKGILNLNNVKTDKDIINNNDLNMTGVVELANVTNNSKLSFDGSLMTVKDFENKADIDIKGNTAADNITNCLL